MMMNSVSSNKIIINSLLLLSIPVGMYARKAQQPNIILINCDDMGYGDLSCYGNPSIKTPNIDRMSIEGQKWTSFYVSSSVSSPSRAGLMTGRLGVRTGMYGNIADVMFPNSPEGLPDEEVTMPELLRKAGYQTAIVGKWHLGHTPEYMPLAHGFDYFYGSPFSNDMSRREQVQRGNKGYPYEYLIYEQDQIVDRDPEQFTLTRRYTEKALEYIDTHSKRPFFLYLAHPMPHFPVYASENFQGKSARGKYGDAVEELDWSVGVILDKLKEKHIDKKTLVIFTSDNGPWLAFSSEGGSAGPLRDGKRSHYEGGFRVPCIFWGAMVKPGLVTDMGSHLDLLPTFCELAGVEVPQDRILDGKSILPTLKDNAVPGSREEFFFYRGSSLFAVRKGNFKLHFLDAPAYGRGNIVEYGQPVLYDIEADPEERYDVAGKYPEVVKKLTDLAHEHQSSSVPHYSIFDLVDISKSY